MLNVAEAIVRVFHRLGDYQHKARNRMKFLMKSLGWEGFRTEFEKELTGFLAEGGASLAIRSRAASRGAGARLVAAGADDVLTVARRVARADDAGPGYIPS